MALTSAYEAIVIRRPIGSLMSPRVIISLLGQIILQLIFQVIIFVILRTQSWFVPLVPDPDSSNYYCYENTTLFLFSIFQYISGSVVFSVGKPFRKPLYTNGGHLFPPAPSSLLCRLTPLLCCLYLRVVFADSAHFDEHEPVSGPLSGQFHCVPCLSLSSFYHPSFLPKYSLGTSPRSFMEIKEIDWPWKFTIIGFAGIHFIVASILETWFFPPLARLLSQHLKKKLKRQKKPYKVLAMDMKRIPLAQVETA